MSINTKLAALLTATCLLPALVVGNNAYAESIPGINASGSPAFLNFVKITIRNDSITVRSNSKDFFLGSPSLGNIGGTSGTYTLSGNWNNQGDFLGGSLSLKGEIPTLNIPKNTTLVTANLTPNLAGINWDPMKPNLIGFNTNTIICDPLLTAAIGPCSSSESVYLTLDDLFDGNFNRGGKDQFRTTGTALTTVPVPAAVWLFGTGLLGLATVTRRRQQETTAAVV